MKVRDIPGADKLTALELLTVPFDNVKWRAGSTTQDKDRAMALAYIDARDVMDRLNQAVGPANWETHIDVSGKIITCTLTLHIFDEDRDQWITRSKTDGAGESDVEGEKGGISDALKRAAVQWGIGRYLYALPSPWVDYDKFKRQLKQTPELPAWARPENWVARILKEKSK